MWLNLGVNGLRINRRKAAEAKKQGEALVDAGKFARRQLSEDPPDAAFVDRPKMVHERARRFRETTDSWVQRGIQCTRSCGTRDRYHCHQGEPLIRIHGRIAHRDAGAQTTLLVANGRIKLNENNGAACNRHVGSCTQPRPAIQRTAVPPLGSTRLSSSRGRSDVQLATPMSASAVVSGWGLLSDWRRDSR